MKRGQTAVEYLILAAVVITVAGITYVNYSTEATATVVQSTIRNQVELTVSQAGFENPGCAEAIYKGMQITKNEDGSEEYEIYLMPEGCAVTLLSGKTSMIQGRITETLGCNYDETGYCKGTKYIVVPHQP